MGARWNRLGEAVLACACGVCCGRKYLRYQNFPGEIFNYIGQKPIYIAWTCFRNDMSGITPEL